MVPDSELTKFLSAFDTSKISDILDDLGSRGAMTPAVKPLWEGLKICGPAVTVEAVPSTASSTGPKLFEAIDCCKKGDVIVVGVNEDLSCDSWGGLVTRCAMARGVAGVITDGPARDYKEIKELGFPVFSNGLIPTSPKGRRIYTDYNIPIVCGGVKVHPQDIILGDDDGVVVIPRDKISTVKEMAVRTSKAEEAIVKAIAQGTSAKEAMTMKFEGLDII
jgi:4-hydroxy-4-methyl-2-oxoglutarate aldolase